MSFFCNKLLLVPTTKLDFIMEPSPWTLTKCRCWRGELLRKTINTVHHIQWSMRHNESINLSLFIYQTCRCTNSVVKSKFVLFAFDVEFVFVKRYHLLMWPNDFKSKNLLGFHGTLIFGTLDGPQLPTKILICSIV